jgi:hypothetical protein
MSIKFNNVTTASFSVNNFKEEMAMMMFGRSFGTGSSWKAVCGLW